MRHVGERARGREGTCGQPGGATLLELIVVLALLGLILAIAAPAFVVPDRQQGEEIATVLATARRAALLRGEPVTLVVDAAGQWRLDGDATSTASPVVSPTTSRRSAGDARPIATGRLATPITALRVRISPLGTCIPDADTDGNRAANAPTSSADAQVSWNALGCGPGGPTSSEARIP